MVKQPSPVQNFNRSGAAQQKQRQGHRWLPYLTLILLTELCLTVHFLRQDIAFMNWLAYWQGRWQEKQGREQLQKTLAHDPPVGFSLAKLGTLEFAVKPETRNSQPETLLLIVFGGCEGCGERVVQEWAETLGNWETWKRGNLGGVLVLQEKAERVKEAAGKGNWQVAVVADKEGKIAKALNAVFLPRAYGFVGGKLVWMQKEPNMGVVSVLESFLKVAKGEREAIKLLNAWAAEMREKAWGKGAAKLIGGREKP